jgi:hypothetical protein
VTQTAHGFAVGDVLRSAGTANAYAKAQADTAAHAEVVGMVTAVADANTFTITQIGLVTSGVPVAAAGSVVFLSAATPGALTVIEPASTYVSKPLGMILTSGSLLSFNNGFRGLLGTGGGRRRWRRQPADGYGHEQQRVDKRHDTD